MDFRFVALAFVCGGLCIKQWQKTTATLNSSRLRVGTTSSPCLISVYNPISRVCTWNIRIYCPHFVFPNITATQWGESFNLSKLVGQYFNSLNSVSLPEHSSTHLDPVASHNFNPSCLNRKNGTTTVEFKWVSITVFQLVYCDTYLYSEYSLLWMRIL